MMKSTIVVTTLLAACLLSMHGSTYAQDATGSGTLTVSGSTYEFQVTWCDLGATQGPDGPTLSGMGTTEAGGFTVTVDRTTLNDMTNHEVSVFMHDGGGSLSSSRVKMGSGWMTNSGIVPDPLIQIEGQRVRATGEFEDESGESGGEGTLEAECNRPIELARQEAS